MILGTVIKSTGSWYAVAGDDEVEYKCRIKGKFRLGDMPLTNPIAVGDRVEVEAEGYEDTAVIHTILPRTNYVVRQSPRKKHNLHLIASNIDRAILIVTIVEPMLKQGFIDRFLLMTEPYRIPVTIVFNKSDLYTEADNEVFAELEAIYTDIGYEVILASAIDGTGLGHLSQTLQGRVTMIAGQSGVGKSTLINAIEPGLDLRTGDISDYSGKGQHTTTFAEMLPLSFGGQIIDTPGIKTLSFNHLEIMDIAHNFRELFDKSDDCRFNNCTHRNEPSCAVKQAVDDGVISGLRYVNYLTLVDEVENQNYWERHGDM